MDTLIRNQFLRTILALCRLSARAEADDIRDDVAGECADALEVWALAAPDMRLASVRRWSDSVTALLERLEGQQGVDRGLLGRAQLMLLRLQARLPQPPKETKPVSVRKPAAPVVSGSDNKAKVLAAVGATMDVRSRELIDQFKGTMAPRTVKRILAELTAEGLVDRVENADRSVSYRPTS